MKRNKMKGGHRLVVQRMYSRADTGSCQLRSQAGRYNGPGGAVAGANVIRQDETSTR